MNSFTKYVASVLFAIPMIASAAVDLVTNGSFEIDSQASGTWNIYNSLTGWTGSPNIELRNNVAGTAYEGVILSNWIPIRIARCHNFWLVLLVRIN